MTVTIDEIKRLKPFAIEPFLCDKDKMYAVATALSTIKRRGLPEGVVNYEHRKFFDKGVVLIHALGEGDSYVLNR
ncbi:MAG: hypothetical protein IJ588_13685 [Prevotella sp.]|nr:hypothetical protein [Prevotella sp.]